MDPASIARARARAQRLWSPTATTPTRALTHVLAVQAQEHTYARWSLAQRTTAPDLEAVDRAFDAGRILRTHVLRPTWHYVAPRDLRWLMALSGPRVDAGIARRYRELELDPKLLARTDRLIASAVTGNPLTRKQIGDLLERKGIATEGQRLPHILSHAELTATICSGPMVGREHTYAQFDERVPAGAPIDRDEAIARLTERYFTTRGPATLKDFTWWSGLSAADARAGVAAVRASLDEQTVDGRTYWFSPGAPDVTAGEPVVDLVQCYDETIISYTQSRDVMRAGRADFAAPSWIDGFAHVVLLDGQLLGHWRIRDGGLETRIAARMSPRERAASRAATTAVARSFGATIRAGADARTDTRTSRSRPGR